MSLRTLTMCLGATVLSTHVACTSAPGPTAKSSAPVVARVNGVSLTEADVELALRSSAHVASAEMPPSERRKGVIEGLIREELIRQKAVELGLEPEGAAADEVARLELQLAAARRRALNEAYFRQQIAAKAEPTDAQARAFFDANVSMIRSELHVWQILLRDEVQMAQAQRDLGEGVPFETVARRHLPQGVGQPWDLGFLTWRQLPEPWRPVVEHLEPGEVSPLIRGVGGRLWVLKLIERRMNPDLTFEHVKPQLFEDLKRRQLEQLALQVDQDLSAAAKVVRP